MTGSSNLHSSSHLLRPCRPGMYVGLKGLGFSVFKGPEGVLFLKVLGARLSSFVVALACQRKRVSGLWSRGRAGGD